jgi:hypothetical protein
MTTMARLYGLTVRSELPLYHGRTMPPGSDVDLDITLGDLAHPSLDAPPGTPMLHLEMDRQYYTAVRDDQGCLLRFYGTCDIRLDPTLRHASVHLHPDADPEIISVLVAGTLLAFVLALRGEPVLHASAVQIGDEALAFVGASGMGKSTTATLFCADGARLITDDVLRLDLTRTPPTCSLGATELRLRKSAGELSEAFTVPPTRRVTGDARDALAVPTATTEDLPLRAIVVPVPDRDGLRETVVEAPDPMTSFLLLSRFPRLLGWQDEEVLRRQFQQLGDLIERVPVFIARMPWGPPFPDDVAASIRRAVAS